AENRGWTFETGLPVLARRVGRDQQLVYLGVPAGAAELLVLCWFALFLAVKYTGEERRPDIGLLALRGARRGRVWALVLGQSAVPMLLAAVAGGVAGYAGAHVFGGGIR